MIGAPVATMKIGNLFLLSNTCMCLASFCTFRLYKLLTVVYTNMSETQCQMLSQSLLMKWRTKKSATFFTPPPHIKCVFACVWMCNNIILIEAPLSNTTDTTWSCSRFLNKFVYFCVNISSTISSTTEISTFLKTFLTCAQLRLNEREHILREAIQPIEWVRFASWLLSFSLLLQCDSALRLKIENWRQTTESNTLKTSSIHQAMLQSIKTERV